MTFRSVWPIALLSILIIFSGYHAGYTRVFDSFFSYAPGDSLDALHYHIFLENLNFTAKTISARTKITIRSKVDQLQQFRLELLNLTVTQVKINNQPVNGFTHQSPWLTIPLPAPVPIHGIFEVEVTYHGTPFSESWGGFHWSGQYAFNLGVGLTSNPHNLGKAWFPCIDDFQDRATYEVSVTVQDPKMAVCGGTLMQIIDHGNGTKTYHWKLHDEIPTYLASVAVGEYKNVPYSFTSVTGETIPIGIYVRPSDTAKVPGTFQTLIPILQAFENHFGPYRWERVGYVGTALGAMEHTTNIAIPHSSITGNLSSEWLIAHEVSHQWFGNLVTCASAADMWINEGWAVFCELLYREALYGPQAYQSVYSSKHRSVLHSAHIADGGYLALYGIPNQNTYGTTVYQKGAIVVHTLRHYLGDELFFPAVQAFLDYYSFKPVNSWQLRDFLSAHSGRDLTDFFQTWVFTPGFPEFSVDSFQVQPSGNQYLVTVFTKQKLKGPCQFANSNRLEITFMDTQWQTETVLMQFSGETGQQTFQTNILPVIAMPDFYDKVADATTDKHLTLRPTTNINLTDVFFRIKVMSMAPSDSGFVRVTHRWVPPDALKVPVQGLTLSDYRHWRITGIFPPQSSITGSFLYNKFNNLDGNLMANPGDSLVILYRPSPASDWQGIPFTKIGSPTTGYLEVTNLQPGDYTLAVWAAQFVHVSETPPATPRVNLIIYPNPSPNWVIMEIQGITSGSVKIFHLNGQLVEKINFHDRNIIQWNPDSLPGGIYLFSLTDQHGNTLCTEKVTIY